jgi:hypothetical protein
MNPSALFYVIAFVTGASLVPLGAPSWLVIGALLGAFFVIIVAGYLIAWRQGHSGIVILPLKNGPFGADGLKLGSSSVEARVVWSSVALIAGLLAGLFFMAS